MIRVGITGGIGSGKSTLCAVFESQGAPVFNSDLEAKRLMNSDPKLRSAIIDLFGEESYDSESQLNRVYISNIVFADSSALERLNAVVHPRVKEEFESWCAAQDADYVILECAILFEAEFDKYVDVSVCVMSPKCLRIERVVSRDGLTTEQVEARISAQMSDDEIHKLATYSVVNIDRDDLDDAAKMLDRKFRYEAAKA